MSFFPIIVRIILGNHKGKIIVAPKNLPVRPTTDIAKEALFNILESRYYLDRKKVLDLFSGTGNISLELRNKGLSTTRWVVNKYYKTAFACIPLIMIVFGLALSIQKPRSSHALGIGLSITVIFMYYALIQFGKTLGYNNILPPLISVWSINLIFLSIGTFIYFKART